MIFLLAWENTRLQFRKRLPIGLFLAAAMALLFLGNSVFSNTDEGLRATYQNSLTGDLSVSASSEDGFTLFGSDLPLIGEYFKNPTLQQYPDIVYRIGRELPESKTLPVLIGGGKLSLGRFDEAAPFFGARLKDYFDFFPGLKLELGRLPPDGQPGLLINATLYEQVVEALKREPRIGERFLFAAALDNSFVLRELPFEGVFSYPVSDQLLDRVVLIDDDTARALNGYYGTSAVISQGSADLLAKESLDDLFAEDADIQAAPQDGITLESVTNELKSSPSGPKVDVDTWNFVLIRDVGTDLARAKAGLSKALGTDRLAVQVRNWRDSAGGNARIVWFIQWIFNVGIIFILLVASLIVMNSLSLSVAERTREIGTMRALGASRPFVGSLIGSETVILVTGASFFGILLGVALLLVAQALGGIPIENPLLASLFGSHRYVPRVTAELIVTHGLLSVLLGLISMVLPIVRALRIAPVQAMARE